MGTGSVKDRMEKGDRHRAASVFPKVLHLRRLGASPHFSLHAYILDFCPRT